jgi:multiple sugar transport system substrate-binding protein
LNRVVDKEIRMKIRMIVGLLLLSLLAFAGCTAPAAAPAPAADDAAAVDDSGEMMDEEVTIVYWADPRFQFVKGMEDETQEVGDYEQILADRFMEMHPNVTVEVETLQWEELSTKVAAAIAAGAAPNVLKDYLGRTSAYANQGLLEPLQDAIPAEEYEDYLPSLVDLYTINGDFHGLPLIFWVTHMYGNKAVFTEAGADALLPDSESGAWTVEQFEEAMAALAVEDERWPLALQVGSEQGDYNTLGFFWANGANLYEGGDYTQTALNSPEGVAALTKLVEWYNAGYVIPGAATMLGEDVNNAMYMGQSGVAGGGLGSLSTADAAQQDGRVTVDWEPFVSLYPAAEGVTSGGMAAGPTSAVVFKQDDPAVRKWSIEFARYLASPELLTEYAVNSNQFPTRVSVPNPFEGNEDFTRVNAWIQEHGVEDMGLSSPTYAEVRVLLQPELQAALLGAKTPEEALADYAEKANAVLAKNK